MIEKEGYSLSGTARKMGYNYNTFKKMLASPYSYFTLEDIDLLNAQLHQTFYKDIVKAILEVRDQGDKGSWFDLPGE